MTTGLLNALEEVTFALILKKKQKTKKSERKKKQKQKNRIRIFFLKLQCTVFLNSRFTAVQWMVYESIIHFYRIVSPLLLKANGRNSLILS